MTVTRLSHARFPMSDLSNLHATAPGTCHLAPGTRHLTPGTRHPAPGQREVTA